MDKIKKILRLEDNSLSISYFVALILLAFVFSMSARYIWVSDFNSFDQFKWNNQLMINTNDGYFWAEGARDILANNHQKNDLSPINTPAALLTALLAKLLPVSFETLILWMPGVLGSLLIIPMMLIGRQLKQNMLGFFSALLASIVWSYYNRTMIGYYDTDMLIVVLPTFVVWGALYSLKNESHYSLILVPIFAILSMYWHGGTINIVNGTFIMAFLYTLIYERKNLYYYKFLSVFVLVLTTLPILLKFLLIISLILIFHFLKDKLNDKFIIGIAIVSAIIYLIFGGFDWIVSILHNAYITRLVASELDFSSLKFYAVVNTVREAGHIPFETFANRISGSTITFWLSLMGYILLLIRHRIMLLSLPMVLLGFFALQGGLRFTVFAVPFMAVGFMFFMFLLAQYFAKLFEDKAKVFAKYVFVSLATIAALYPNIKHIISYKVPTVFMKSEVEVLDKLGKMASREDYVVSWWDYGYPIRYYADMKTLVDGGKHTGKVNFPVSFALTKNQVAAANMARLDVEFTEKSFTKHCGTSIECMMKAYGVKNPNTFLNALNNKKFQRPSKTRNIYFYLPNRMLNIYPTIELFSSIDLVSGKSGARPFLFISRNYKNDGDLIHLGNNIVVDKKAATLKVGSQVVPLNYFMHTSYDTSGLQKLEVHEMNKNEDGISLIFRESYKQFLVVDNKTLNSLYFRLFILESYDKELFEPVFLTPYAKVYKLKI